MYFAAMKIGGVGQINQLLWSTEAWCDHSQQRGRGRMYGTTGVQ